MYLWQTRAGPHDNFHYVLGDADRGEAAIIDPAFELERIFCHVESEGFRIRQAWFTHGHWDHIGGIPEIFDRGVERAHIHRAAADHVKLVEAGDRAVLHDDGDVLRVAGLEVEWLHTPGHQPEGSCFLTHGEPRYLFGGDTLFIGSCGRTDFPGGDTEAMFASMARLRELPDDVLVLPGHDYADVPQRGMGEERRANPALATHDRAAFGQLYCLTH